MKMNANVKVLGRLTPYKFPWQEKVADKDLTAPPGSPSAGDRYIVAATATGDWTGLEDDIVEYNGTSWDVVWDSSVEGNGAKVFVSDENAWYEYNSGSWTAEAGSTVSSLNDLDDVTLAGLADAHIMIFDNTLGDFENKALSGDGFSITKEGAVTIDHDQLTNFVANEHIDHSSVTLTAGAGLSGGGDITTSRSFSVNVDDSSIEIATDTLQVKALGITDAMLAGSISFSKLADSANIARLDQAETVAAVWSFGANIPTVSADPTSANELTRKSYVDGLVNGLSWKDAVQVATTANITLSGEQTIDGVLTSGSRVLVKDQTAPAENGIYISASGAWSRASDMDDAAEFDGAAVFVQEGSTNADKGFTQTATVSTVDTDSVSFTQFTGLGQITAGAGLTKTGDTIDVGAGNGINVNADDVEVDPYSGADTSIAPVSVDADGVGVDTDDVTIDHAAGVLGIKDGGVDTAQLADDAVTAAKIAAGALSRYNAVIGGSTAIAVNHALGLTNANACHITMHDVNTGEQVIADSYTFTDGNNLTVNFASAPDASSIRINISSAEDV